MLGTNLHRMPAPLAPDLVFGGMFVSRSHKAEFANNLATVMRAVVAFYRHCRGGSVVACDMGILHTGKGVASVPDINKVITTVDLIVSLLPDEDCRRRAMNGIAGITVDGGKISLVCRDSSAVFIRDARSIGHIIHNALQAFYCSTFALGDSSSLVGVGCSMGSQVSEPAVFGGMEGLLGRRLNHLRNSQFLPRLLPTT